MCNTRDVCFPPMQLLVILPWYHSWFFDAKENVCKCFRWNVFLLEDGKPQLLKLVANKQWMLGAWLCLTVSYIKWFGYLQHDAKYIKDINICIVNSCA